jgi:hypothetical protein
MVTRSQRFRQRFFGSRTRASRKTEFTIETENVLIIRNKKRKSFSANCGICGCNSQMITPKQAALIIQTTQREIYRLVEENKLHFIELQDGDLFVCAKSLAETTNAAMCRSPHEVRAKKHS